MVLTSPAPGETPTTSPDTASPSPGSPAPPAVGRRLVGALTGALLAALVAGRATASARDAMFGTVSDSAIVAVIIAEVYLCLALALGVVFGRCQRDRESVLGLRRPPERAMLLGAVAWAAAYLGAAVLYLGTLHSARRSAPWLTSCWASALTGGDWQTRRCRLWP